MEDGSYEQYEDESYADSLQRQIMEYKSQYVEELRLNSELKIDNERQDIAIRRRIAIDSYYDHYIYPHFDTDDYPNYQAIIDEFEENLSVSVDNDYENILINLRDKEFQRLQEEEMKEHHRHFYRQRTAYDDEMEYIRQSLIIPPPPPRQRRKSVQHMNQSNILYQVDTKIEENEKKWMKRLKMKKFQIYMHRKKHQRLQIKRIELECKIQDLQTKVWDVFVCICG